jgi:hypothetical protein
LGKTTSCYGSSKLTETFFNFQKIPQSIKHLQPQNHSQQNISSTTSSFTNAKKAFRTREKLDQTTEAAFMFSEGELENNCKNRHLRISRYRNSTRH